VAEQIERLTRAFLQGARDLSIESKTPADSVGPLVVLRAKDAAVLIGKLTERGVVVSARHDGVRFAFHVYNTLDDIHTALAALEENLDLLVRV
jgi:kynureninase